VGEVGKSYGWEDFPVAVRDGELVFYLERRRGGEKEKISDNCVRVLQGLMATWGSHRLGRGSKIVEEEKGKEKKSPSQAVLQLNLASTLTR